MSVRRSARTVLLGLLGVAAAALAAYVGVRAVLHRPGELHVLAPGDRRVSVDIDGALAGRIPAGRHDAFPVSRGTHVVDITLGGGRETVSYAFRVPSGLWEGVAPSSAEQCLAQLEVSGAFYEGARIRDGMLPLPRLVDRFRGGAGGRGVVTAGGAVYFAVEELPAEVTEGAEVYLVLEIPCDLMDAPERDVVAGYLGFRGYEERGLFER